MPADQSAAPPMASPLDHAIAERDRQVLKIVRESLRRGDGVLAYQPVVAAADPARVAFYEGLVRVRDETGRIIPAKDFIAVTETHEIGRMIDCLALELGMRALAGSPQVRLSINMSARSIGYADWMATMNRWLEKDASLAERLILEITEGSAIVIPDIVSAFMDDMQLRGVGFALDDFGAGFTSFRYLRDFFFDAIKIDGEYVDGIAEDPGNQAAVRAMVALGRSFEMFTVAEKVGNEADAAFLREAGVDCLQGYHFGVPTIREPWLDGGRAAKRA